MELVRRWEDSVYRIAYRVTGDAAAAQDIQQAVFLRLLERPEAIRRADRFGAWLKRAVVNESISVLRRRRRRFRAGTESADPDDCADPGQGPEELFVEAEETRRLGEALARLAPEDRALLALRFDEDLTFREIATVLERPVSTVKSQIQKAITRLRRVMGKESGRS